MSRQYTCDGCGACGYSTAGDLSGWACTVAAGDPMDLCPECVRAVSEVYQSRLPALRHAEAIALDGRRRARLGIK